MTNDVRATTLSRRQALSAATAVVATVAIPPAHAASAGHSDRVASDAAVPVPPQPVGSDGLTDWQRAAIADMATEFRGRDHPIRPMASIRGLSPDFMEMAIELDVALCYYRDIASHFHVVLEELAHHGVPEHVVDSRGKSVDNPFIEELFLLERASMSRVYEITARIERSNPLTIADRRLQVYAPTVRNCNNYRQIDAILNLRGRLRRHKA